MRRATARSGSTVPPDASGGFTLIEALVGLVVGSLALAGAFRLWQTNQEESFRIRKKAELRDKMALSSKHIQRSITLAGMGMSRAPTLLKEDAVGSDTLIIYTNEGERRSGLLSNLYVGQYAVLVDDPSLFSGARFLAVSDGARGEVRPIARVVGGAVVLALPLASAYDRATASALPARREKYFTDQDGSRLIRSVDGTSRVLASDIRNFQVSFRDRTGGTTDDAGQVRTVHFSFTGIFPARPGALNSIVFTSTAIPRNVL